MVIEVAPAPTLAPGPGGGAPALTPAPGPGGGALDWHPDTVAAAAMATVMKISPRIRKLNLVIMLKILI